MDFYDPVRPVFLNSDFANWSGEDGKLHWIGRWDGLTSLYDHSTLGLAWFCLLMTAVLWLALPARRPIIVWMLAMLVGALVVFSVVFASLFNVTSLVAVIGYTNYHAGRYLLPMLLAWFATPLTIFFRISLPWNQLPAQLQVILARRHPSALLREVKVDP